MSIDKAWTLHDRPRRRAHRRASTRASSGTDGPRQQGRAQRRRAEGRRSARRRAWAPRAAARAISPATTATATASSTWPTTATTRASRPWSPARSASPTASARRSAPTASRATSTATASSIRATSSRSSPTASTTTPTATSTTSPAGTSSRTTTTRTTTRATATAPARRTTAPPRRTTATATRACARSAASSRCASATASSPTSNDFAKAVIYGADNGAKVVQEALGTINQTAFATAAIDYAYSQGRDRRSRAWPTRTRATTTCRRRRTTSLPVHSIRYNEANTRERDHVPRLRHVLELRRPPLAQRQRARAARARRRAAARASPASSSRWPRTRASTLTRRGGHPALQVQRRRHRRPRVARRRTRGLLLVAARLRSALRLRPRQRRAHDAGDQGQADPARGRHRVARVVRAHPRRSLERADRHHGPRRAPRARSPTTTRWSGRPACSRTMQTTRISSRRCTNIPGATVSGGTNPLAQLDPARDRHDARARSRLAASARTTRHDHDPRARHRPLRQRRRRAARRAASSRSRTRRTASTTISSRASRSNLGSSVEASPKLADIDGDGIRDIVAPDSARQGPRLHDARRRSRRGPGLPLPHAAHRRPQHGPRRRADDPELPLGPAYKAGSAAAASIPTSRARRSSRRPRSPTSTATASRRSSSRRGRARSTSIDGKGRICPAGRSACRSCPSCPLDPTKPVAEGAAWTPQHDFARGTFGAPGPRRHGQGRQARDRASARSTATSTSSSSTARRSTACRSRSSRAPTTSPGPSRIMSTPAVADFNGDGIPEIMSRLEPAGRRRRRRGPGLRGRRARQQRAGRPVPAELADHGDEPQALPGRRRGHRRRRRPSADFDGDGQPDVLMQGNGSRPLVVQADPGVQVKLDDPPNRLPLRVDQNGMVDNGFEATSIFGEKTKAARRTSCSRSSASRRSATSIRTACPTSSPPAARSTLAGALAGGGRRAVPGQQLLAIWSGKTGKMLPGSPVVIEDYTFLVNHAIADVSGDDYPEVDHRHRRLLPARRRRVRPRGAGLPEVHERLDRRDGGGRRRRRRRAEEPRGRDGHARRLALRLAHAGHARRARSSGSRSTTTTRTPATTPRSSTRAARSARARRSCARTRSRATEDKFDAGGCGCRTTPSPASGAGVAAALGALAIVRRRRRRRNGAKRRATRMLDALARRARLDIVRALLPE